MTAAPALKTIPICSTCKEPHGRIGQRHCRKCHAAYQKMFRLKEREKLLRLRRLVAELTECLS